ncbi:MAG TPA: SDR family oxidoreductase [Candidatus Melainabacteria bacterium]|nr:SDR family oxidoreductase [Candidatus Melainabacteria bacterium]HIN63985.1 SDR family oxidoreductase [Candidatus Obscuribacterales bacterium]
MKIVVLGGNGLIGSKTVEFLKKQGHEVVAGSSKSGVNAVTGEGLAQAFKGADAVIDVMNSPSWADNDVMEFFKKSTENVLAAELEAGVKHHVALSVVGTARLQKSGYFRAKQAQEDLIKEGRVPYTIVQATQFFEFLGGIADFGADGEGKVHLSTGGLQPIAAEDVSSVMAEVATAKPLNSTLEIGGPERARLCDFVSKYMEAKHDKREIVARPDANYYGMQLDERSLVPEDNARRTPTKFEDWLCAAVK